MGRISITAEESDWVQVLDGNTGLGSGRVREFYIQGSILRDVSLGSNIGANVIICSECGYKSAFHECILRSHTRIFEVFKAEEGLGASSRDVFGNYVFILEGADWEAVKGLADLLYLGKCEVSTERASKALKGLLSPKVCGEVSSSVSSSARGLASLATNSIFSVSFL